MTTVDLAADVLDDLYFARGLGARAVARDRHKVHVAGNGDLAGQVSHEDVGTLEHADDQRVLVLVVRTDACAQLCDLIGQLLLGK